MDALPFIKEMLSKPVLRVFLSYPHPTHVSVVNRRGDMLWLRTSIHFRMLTPSRKQTEDEKLETIKYLQFNFRRFGISRRDFFGRNSRKGSYWSSYRELSRVKGDLDYCVDKLVSLNYLEHKEVAGELEHKVDIETVINSLHDIKSMEDVLLANANSSNCFTNYEKSQALLLITAIPALHELKDPYEMLRFLLELSTELDNLPALICKACKGQPQPLLLIGGLLSVKPRTYDTWNRVKDDLLKIKQSNNGASDNYMSHIYTYCYEDLSYSLTACFLYLACYPINYEIPARSLTEIWIAEEFVEEHDGETVEETANKYLKQLVQRYSQYFRKLTFGLIIYWSLVWVSKRSISGVIRCCRVRQSIHEFCIKNSYEAGFLAANPNKQEMESVPRVAFYNDEKKHYTEGEFERDRRYHYFSSVVCFDFDMNVLEKNILQKIVDPDVLELRNSVIPQTFLPNIDDLKRLTYLGLRGSKKFELPENIGDIKRLKTLDVRETNIKTLPKSLWNIKTLRHVYVKSSPQIEGPPSTANIDDLQILKTVAVPESWRENVPQFLRNFRKLALSNRDNPNSKPNPYWKSISKMLSHMSNLLSMTNIGDIVPSEFVDIRAFPNLETVKSIKFEGEWICRKLFIDHVKFPPNIVKLTLIKSGLKEDPISMLGRLQTLKYLSLQDGAYTGKKIVCSANGFPQLRFLELFKLDNLEVWEVKPMAMSQLTTLRVVQCLKLKNLPSLEHVTDKVIEN